jgi:hypothetical protein
MASKYSPLETYLRELPSTQKEVSLSHAEIEGIWKSGTPSGRRPSYPDGHASPNPHFWGRVGKTHFGSFLSDGHWVSLRLVVQQAPPRSGRLGGVGFDLR